MEIGSVASQLGWPVPHERATQRVNERGFTLIELLIAVAIFAVVAVTVYTRSGDSIRQLGALEERTWPCGSPNELARCASRANSEHRCPPGRSTAMTKVDATGAWRFASATR
jgi:prepilin-type N-terminal cleavage/methylation domain-containing protein